MKLALLILLLLASALALVACGSVRVVSQPTPTPTAVIPPTVTAAPTTTPSPTATIVPTDTPVPGPAIVSFADLGLSARIDGLTLVVADQSLQLFAVGLWDELSREVKPEWLPSGASACGLARDTEGMYSYFVACSDNGLSAEAFKRADVNAPVEIPSGNWEQIRPDKEN